MLNALSIDLEDWFCVANLRHIFEIKDWGGCDLRVEQSTAKILELLDKYNVIATFFVLGWIAERVPSLIAEIADKGHEIATHGYSHTLLTEMTPSEFESDLRKALAVTNDIVDCEIIGFRAPSFTVTGKTMWAVDVLKENGINYDSSVFPAGFHPDYGMPNADLNVFEYDNGLIEFPLTCVEIFGKRIPCGGGGYFRLYPYPVTKFLLSKCNRQGRSALFYLHPWEFDPDQPKVKLPPIKRFRHYNNLEKTFGRFERLLNDFKFTTVRGVLGL